jgi:hypothetical protein
MTQPDKSSSQSRNDDDLPLPAEVWVVCDQMERGKYSATFVASYRQAAMEHAADMSEHAADCAMFGPFRVARYVLAVSEKQAPITDNDRRWRFLEHGCQWVSWTPINGQTVSFDPRNSTGYRGDLKDMRGQDDIEIRKQLAILQERIDAANR